MRVWIDQVMSKDPAHPLYMESQPVDPAAEQAARMEALHLQAQQMDAAEQAARVEGLREQAAAAERQAAAASAAAAALRSQISEAQEDGEFVLVKRGGGLSLAPADDQETPPGTPSRFRTPEGTPETAQTAT